MDSVEEVRLPSDVRLPYYLVLRNRDYIIGLPVWDISFGLPYYLVLRNPGVVDIFFANELTLPYYLVLRNPGYQFRFNEIHDVE